MESLCQRSLRGGAAVNFIKTIEKTDMLISLINDERNVNG